MRDSFFVVLSEFGVERMTKRKGSLRRGEVAVQVWITVPDSSFVDPLATAHIVVPETAIIHPQVLVEVEEQPA